MEYQSAACIGAGIIGRSWAIVFARQFEHVYVYDIDPAVGAAARDATARSLASLHASNLVDDPTILLSRIRVVGSLDEAVASADFVQESVPENLTLKKTLFSEIDRLARPDAILASSTSELPPSGFLSHLRGRARCLVAHPLNPPHLIPAIEVCPAPFTSSSTVHATFAMLKAVGQRPLLVKQEINGFVMNRLQIAVLRESLSLVERGICSVADLDIAMKYGLARRWAVMGPYETNYLSTDGDYVHFLEVYGPTLKSIADDLERQWDFGGALGGRIDAELRERLHGEAREATSARRDRNLARLAKQGIES